MTCSKVKTRPGRTLLQSSHEDTILLLIQYQAANGKCMVSQWFILVISNSVGRIVVHVLWVVRQVPMQIQDLVASLLTIF